MWKKKKPQSTSVTRTSVRAEDVKGYGLLLFAFVRQHYVVLE